MTFMKERMRFDFYKLSIWLGFILACVLFWFFAITGLLRIFG